MSINDSTTLKYSRILRRVSRSPWAMEPQRLADVLDVLSFKVQGGQLSAEEIREYCGLQAAERVETVTDSGSAVAVLRFRGIVAHHIEAVEDVSGPGGTSVEGFRSRLRGALADDSVGAVVIEFDSPGGSVEGVEELGAEVFEARGGKPIVASVNALAASAAFWIASQADEVSVTPSGMVGSIGVFAAHEDLSEALAEQGRKITLIHAGKFKVEGSPFEPLSDEAREHIQSLVDEAHEKFVGAVARGRDTSAATVKNDFGQGRLVSAKQALEAGMVDHIETFEETVNRMRAVRSQSSMRAEMNLRRHALAFS